MKSQLSTKYLDKLKTALPSDGMERISEKLNISLSTVSRALAGKGGKRVNQVAEAAIDLIGEEQQKVKNLEKKIDSLEILPV
ncbi:hypothetical protein ACR789_13920 [Sphingobacterium siyangense]|uniref:hypothetical protein n=1 Tax=Sphingobacterium TaxID=28453 RepID=UPI000E8372D0|nr:hypothetical protein [Sphingobacterium sp.]